MILKCIMTQCNYPILVLPQTRNGYEDYVSSSESFTIDSETFGYKLTENNFYKVYGILFYKEQIRFLIMDDDNMPGFFPSTIFMIENSLMYFDYECRKYQINNSELIIIGYSDLVNNYDEICDLMFLRESAIENFLYNKDIIDKWH